MFGYIIKSGDVSIALVRKNKVTLDTHFRENEELIKCVFDDKTFEHIKSRLLDNNRMDIVAVGIRNGFCSIKDLSKK